MTLIALIPARIGSKGIHKKNLRIFKGKPLIAWTISQALESSHLERIIVSTDDEEVAHVAKKFGAEVPFLRPKKHSNDSSPVIDTILHAFNNLPDVTDILLMQPTSPLRRVVDINNIIELRKTFDRESAASFVEVSEFPELMFNIDKKRIRPILGNFQKSKRRQNFEKLHMLNGSLFLSSKRHIIKNNSLLSEDTLPYLMPKENSVDIDEELDWRYAEFLYDKIIK